MGTVDYNAFIDSKTQLGGDHGFEPLSMPDMLFDFQKSLVEWACRKGRAAIFADCGLGKTFMQLAWAQNVVQKTSGRVLILTPLAVAPQTISEAGKIGVEAIHSRDGGTGGKIIVTNYEKLHLYNPDDFVGFVGDESSILKHYTGATQKQVTRFIGKMPYRLLCTATAAPNDYIELGTSSEALGELSNSEMLTRFFRYRDDKGQKQDQKANDFAEKAGAHFGKLSFRVAQSIGQWRLKGHAVNDFWRWVSSWSRACRMPSDLGFSDAGFELPPLQENRHIIMPESPRDGWLFVVPAFGLQEEREERKRTINQRCEFAAKLADHKEPVVVWCHTNAEGDLLESLIPGARQIAGRTPDDEKEEIYAGFASGQIRALVIKPKIGAWGLNWQHCNHVITFASHSYEQYYQSIRRCWRFGQKRPVTVDVIATKGEERVIENMQRKSDQAQVMFDMLVRNMNNAMKIGKESKAAKKVEVPKWL